MPIEQPSYPTTTTDLVEHLGGYVDEQVAAVPAAEVTQAELDTALEAKADLVGGEVPADQLPDLVVADNSVTLAKLDAAVRAKLGGAPGRKIDPRDYGAKVDGRRITDARSTGTSSNLITSATYTFTSDDIGKLIGIALPIGSLPDAHITTITGVNAGRAVLAANPPATIQTATDLECVFGTNDDAAYLAAMNAAAPTTSLPAGTVVIPPGRSCVQATLQLLDYVSWEGYGREVSIVSVLKNTGSTNTAATSSWMVVAPSGTDRLTGASFRHFKIEGRFHTTTVYHPSVKPFNLYLIRRVFVHDMWLDRTPATSIPCDQGAEACHITHNLITGPGRMNDGSGAGGSGIGMGTRELGDPEPTLVAFNTIIGTLGRGVNGIFTENQMGTELTAPIGYRIIGNYIESMKFGITGAGSRGMVVEGNTINKCWMAGVAMSQGTLPSGYPDEHFAVVGNVIMLGITTGAPVGAEGHGILIDTSVVSGRTQGRGLIAGNVIQQNRGNGILVKIGVSSGSDLTIRGNKITRNGLSGVRFWNATGSAATVRHTQVAGNWINDNGTRATAGDRSGVTINASAVNLNITNNDLGDIQGTRTQDYGVLVATGVTLTDGSIRDNECRYNLTGGLSLSGGATFTNTWIARNAGGATPAPAVVSATASPMTYTAPAHPSTLYLNGGTVTALTVRGVAVDPATKVLPLEPSDPVVITYSSAPALAARAR